MGLARKMSILNAREVNMSVLIVSRTLLRTILKYSEYLVSTCLIKAIQGHEVNKGQSYNFGFEVIRYMSNVYRPYFRNEREQGP